MKPGINKYFILITFLAVMSWLWGVNEPYVGAYGANQNYFTLASKNFIRFGYLKLNFLPTYYAGGDLSQIPDLYLHHPVLYFTLVSLPFLFFGFHNWISAVTPIIFSLLSLFWLFKIGSFVWNKRIGYWSAFFGAVFPMMAVFGKQTIFEPAVLSLLLGSYFYLISYLKFKKTRSLINFTIFSFLAILIDWGGVYFIFPLILLFKLLPKSKEKFRAILSYLIVCFIGISAFLLAVLRYQGSFNDLINAFNIRKNSGELFSLSFPYFRLVGVTILRLIVYFTPLSIFLLPNFFKNILKSYTLLFFFIFGVINIVVLPTATFGHIFFLFYFIPFFSFLFSLYTEKLVTKNIYIAWLMVFSVCIFSFFVSFMKVQQVKKQTWRYTAAYEINSNLLPYETIGVLGFPGDVFEQYFFHPTVSFKNYEELLNWLNTADEKKAVFSCWGDCTNEDFEFVENLPYKRDQFNKAWLISNFEVETPSFIKVPHKQNLEDNRSQPVVLKWYRTLRDIFSVGQL